MFNLIVTILALVLMIGAAIAGLTYLGPAFTQSQTKANVAAMLNAGLQFQGANALYKSDFGGAPAPSVAALSPNYLSIAPVIPAAFQAGAGWSIADGSDGNSATLSLDISKNVPAAIAACKLMAAEVGATGPYGCDSTTAPTVFNFSL